MISAIFSYVMPETKSKLTTCMATKQKLTKAQKWLPEMVIGDAILFLKTIF